jgi:hypothetical protein
MYERAVGHRNFLGLAVCFSMISEAQQSTAESDFLGQYLLCEPVLASPLKAEALSLAVLEPSLS